MVSTTEKFKLERRNPLPIGRYWQDIFESQFKHFEAWLNINRNKVEVVSQENFEAGGLPFDRSQDFPARRWYLFEVLEPVFWQGPGLPTIAGTVEHSNDTERPTEDLIPGPFEPGGAFADLKEPLTKTAMLMGAILAGGMVLSALFNRVIGR